MRLQTLLCSFVLVAIVLVGLTCTCSALGDIVGVSVRGSSGFPDGRWPVNTVNGSGLDGGNHVNNPPQTMWLTSGAGDPNPNIVFDLGAVYTVDSLRVWNYNENANPTCCTGRGIATTDILIAGEDQVFTSLVAGQAMAIAPGTNTDFSETIALGGVAARYVKLDNITNHNDPTYTGLSEVRFAGDLVPGQDLPLPATIHSVSSNLVGFDRVADYLVDRSGLLGSTHGIRPDNLMWLNQGSFGNETPDLDPEIIFDLGSVVPLDRMQIWNYNEILPGRADLLNRGISSLDILISEDGVDFTLLIEEQQLGIAPGDETVDFSETISLNGALARFVKFDNLTNFPGGDNDFVGLSEVQFYAVPEPSTLLLLVAAALGALVWTVRRQKPSA